MDMIGKPYVPLTQKEHSQFETEKAIAQAEADRIYSRRRPHAA